MPPDLKGDDDSMADRPTLTEFLQRTE